MAESTSNVFNRIEFVSPVNPLGFAVLAVTVLSALPVFWFGMQALGAAWVTPEYSHGPLIPLISLYLFLREMRFSPPAPDHLPDRMPGVAVMGLALVITLMGQFAQIPDIVCYALIIWIMGLVLVCFGWHRGRNHWAPVLHLVFMLPLPQFLYWKLSIFLQGVSSELGVMLVDAFGIPVYLDGNIIDLGVYKLQVAEACSGLRYLFPILSFSYLFSILYRGPLWHKAIMLLSAAPITVLMNSFRIGVIGIMVNYRGIEAAEGFLHFFEGWVIFLGCVGILFLLATLLQRLRKNPLPLSEAVDLDFEGLATQATRVFAVAPSRGLLAAASLSILASGLFLAMPAPETTVPDRRNFVSFPQQIGEYRGSKFRLDPDVEQTLDADDYLSSSFTDSRNLNYDLFVAYYVDQTSGGGIHSPEVCLPNGGWEVFSIDPYEVDMTGTPYGTFTVNRAVIQKGLSMQLVYYWFEQRGTRMTNDVKTKFAVVVDSWTRGRKDGAMVRFITPVIKDDIAGADARLQEFMRTALPRLPDYVPF